MEQDKTGIEVYPKESDLVDEANMYHLWILPKEMELPFTLWKKGEWNKWQKHFLYAL